MLPCYSRWYLSSATLHISRAFKTVASSGLCRPLSSAVDNTGPTSTATGPSPLTSPSIDSKEVKKFEQLSQEWWSPQGPFAALHALNRARVGFIRSVVAAHFSLKPTQSDLLRDLKVLDVGCGGGILAEPLVRLGASVTGVDVTPQNIGAASAHAALDPFIKDRVRYQCKSAEDLADAGEGFDVVIASEVIEHVKRPQAFCETLSRLMHDKGCVVVTTINRTPESYAKAIIAAEKVLGWIPDGTHDWNKFLTPAELQLMFEGVSLEMQYLAGMELDLRANTWSCTDNYAVNYAAMFSKRTT